jgi:putative hemolysin
VILFELWIVLVLVLVNGFLAGSEIAIVSMRKTRVDELVAKGSGGAIAVDRLRKSPERFLATVQIGITVIGAAAGAFGGASMARDLEPVLRPFVGERTSSVAFALVVGLIAFLTLVLGELVPKSLALRSSERYALLVGRPLLLLSWLSRPLVWLLTATSNLVLRVFGDSTTFMEARLSAGELRQLVGEATVAGSVHPTVGAITARAIEFGDVTVAQVMVPRHKVVSIPVDVSRPELRRLILEEGKTRFVVLDQARQDVLGYVTLRDAVAVMEEGSLMVLRDALREPVVAPSTMRCVDLLSEMRGRRVQLAVVVNELGAMIGIATLEDVVEEIVGEIEGEHDQPTAPAFVERRDGLVDVRGDAVVHELNRRLELTLPETERSTTIAGLVIALAGKIPRPGHRVTLSDGTGLEVLDATAKRIMRVRLKRPPSSRSSLA